MSGFDEEAERERLREKYERDREKRAATQRMSELLLKGATMTNGHCDACGDPIFRHDGQEFCPTCQAADQGAAEGDAAATADAESGDAEGEPEPEPDAAPATNSGATPAAEAAEAAEAAAPDGRSPSGTSGEATGDVNDSRVRELAGNSGATRTQPPSSRGANAPLNDARASLSRTLVRYARAAEEADDPRRAKELLAAAREAAETIAALDRR